MCSFRIMFTFHPSDLHSILTSITEGIGTSKHKNVFYAVACVFLRKTLSCSELVLGEGDDDDDDNNDDARGLSSAFE